jgi:hypothetical protein
MMNLIAVMSALPPKTRHRRCGRSCRLATSGLTNRSKMEICDGRADCRHFEAESHGGPEVDHRLEFGRMLHRDGFARLFTLQAAVGQVGLFRRLIAHFVQDFCDWRGCCRASAPCRW